MTAPALIFEPNKETFPSDTFFLNHRTYLDGNRVAMYTNARSSGYTSNMAEMLLDIGDIETLYRQTFDSLANEWERKTRYLSSIDRIILNDAYQRIIGMGYSIVPLILERLQHTEEMWFPALASITGGDPVPQERRGDFEYMRQSWLEWGRRNVADF